MKNTYIASIYWLSYAINLGIDIYDDVITGAQFRKKC